MEKREEKLYEHVSRALENDILTGVLQTGEFVPSTHQYAARFAINPATAARGVSQLTQQGILEKRRGLGMVVALGARETIMERRREAFRALFLQPMLEEAQKIGIPKRDLLAMVMASDT